MRRRTFFVTLGAALTSLRARAQPTKPAGAAPLPPLSYSCPMHPEVVDNAPGKCPICGMEMVKVRLALVWTCPLHTQAITETAAGQCPLCGRDLIRVTKAVSFTCPVHKSVGAIDPRKCPRCSRTLVERYSVRPHGDHNPKHGGSFFMVSNNWHLEVTHPAPSVFRLYVYDNYSKPFAPPGLAARIIEAPDRAGRRADVDVPFKKARGYYEARMEGLTVPATIAAKVRFETGDKEYRFDFIFTDYSKEPVRRPRR